jgi:hypothetical protein
MRHIGTIPLGIAVLATAMAAAPAAHAGTVAVNGVTLPRALGSVEATIDVTEFRDGNDPTVIRLVAGSKRYSVCVLTPDPVAVFDAELPLAASPDRFTVTVEDGREFSACLVERLEMVERPPARPRNSGPVQAYRYWLRCENVTVPAP